MPAGGKLCEATSGELRDEAVRWAAGLLGEPIEKDRRSENSLWGDLKPKKESELLLLEWLATRDALRWCWLSPALTSGLVSATFLKVIVHSTFSPAKIVWSFHFTKTWIFDGMAARSACGPEAVLKADLRSRGEGIDENQRRLKQITKECADSRNLSCRKRHGLRPQVRGACVAAEVEISKLRDGASTV